MTTSFPAGLNRRQTVARNLGGVAPHFRVQFHDDVNQEWSWYATFRDRGQAERCIETLTLAGCEARVVDCNRCPAAA